MAKMKTTSFFWHWALTVIWDFLSMFWHVDTWQCLQIVQRYKQTIHFKETPVNVFAQEKIGHLYDLKKNYSMVLFCPPVALEQTALPSICYIRRMGLYVWPKYVWHFIQYNSKKHCWSMLELNYIYFNMKLKVLTFWALVTFKGKKLRYTQ